MIGPADTLREDVKIAEMKVATFIVEHNISFQAMDHLSDLLTNIFPDSKIASQFKCKHTKIRSIIKNLLARRFRNELRDILKSTFFSIIIDESNNIATEKQLAIVVRYFSERENKVKSQFFKLIEVAAGDATTLVSTITSFFEKENIPLKNMIGYSSDTTNVMFGQHHSVVSVLKNRLPHIVVIKCLCHTAHLCASYACEKLPRAIESLIRDIYSYFSHSAKRIAQYKTFQHFTNTKPHKILKPAQTRWLSLEMCVVRVLEQWSALEAFFESSSESDRLVSSQSIVAALKNPVFKLYYYFLKYVLPKFTKFNQLYQSEKPNIHFVAQSLTVTYKAFLMSTTYLQSRPIDEIDPTSSPNMLPLFSMSMGSEVSQFLSQPDIGSFRREIVGFLEHVQLFYIEAATQIKQRFPINDRVLKKLGFLNPDTISSTTVAQVLETASLFPNIMSIEDIEKIDDEWREITFMDRTDLPEYSGQRSDVGSFWGSVGKIQNVSGSLKFPAIGKLTKALLAIPHSNADVERIFSHVTLIKVKQRNKLKTSTVDAMLMVKQGMPCQSCIKFTPDQDMCNCMNTSMYLSDSTSGSD